MKTIKLSLLLLIHDFSKKSFYLIFLALFCLFLLFFSFNGAIFTVKKLNSQFSDNLKVTLLLKDTLTKTETAALQEQLLTEDSVKMIQYRLKSQVFSKIEDELQTKFSYIENPFENQFLVTLTANSNVKESVEALEKLPGVDSIVYNEAYLDKILFITKTIHRADNIVFIVMNSLMFLLFMTLLGINNYYNKPEITVIRKKGLDFWQEKRVLFMNNIFLWCLMSAVSFAFFAIVYHILYEKMNTLSTSFSFMTPQAFFVNGIGIWVFIGILASLVSLIYRRQTV